MVKILNIRFHQREVKQDVKEHGELTNRTKLIPACNVSLAARPFHAKLSIEACHVYN